MCVCVRKEESARVCTHTYIHVHVCVRERLRESENAHAYRILGVCTFMQGSVCVYAHAFRYLFLHWV